MDPVYSLDETVAVFKDFFIFLTQMYMDPDCIEEPPEGGWPNITQETMRQLKKHDNVIELLRHLPRVLLDKRPEILPKCLWMDWTVRADELINEEFDGETILTMSQGWECQFKGKIPRHCIGLTLVDRDEDVIILETSDGMVHWQVCPQKFQDFASPQPGWLDYSLEEGMNESADAEIGNPTSINDEHGDVSEEDEGGAPGDHSVETPPTSDDEERGDGEQEDDHEEFEGDTDSESETSSDDGQLLRWGPSWPVRHFFEMLKNHFRELNFIPKTSSIVIDTWQTKDRRGDPLPDGILDLMKSIYRKHGWPDLTKYDKAACLAEIEKELEEKYPGHRSLFRRFR